MSSSTNWAANHTTPLMSHYFHTNCLYSVTNSATSSKPHQCNPPSDPTTEGGNSPEFLYPLPSQRQGRARYH
eukprot:1795137-Ditylum_brightwellii.AAC.1